MLVRDMQRPILKDGAVVNVIEIDENTKIVTKEEHKALAAAEDAEHEQRLGEWRAVIAERRREVNVASEALGMLKAMLKATKVNAEKAATDAEAARLLQQILALEKEVSEGEKAIAAMLTVPLPAKPKLVRAKRWFHPDGLEAGPAGGNIGDLWGGATYTRPEKLSSDSGEAARPVA